VRTKEPPNSGALWHLGMTRGAMLAFLFFFVVVFVGFTRTEQIARRQSRASSANKAAIKVQHHALSEVCRQTSLLKGAVQIEIDVIRFGLATRVPLGVRQARRVAIATLEGYVVALNENSLCSKVVNP
jgi:hypothetical protein